MSFPPGTEMFQFPGFASRPYGFRPGSPKGRGFPIRTSADQRSLASPRGFSQRATSFIASWRQGIHRTPFSRSGSQPPPPARRTEPRPPRARVVPHERPWKPHHPARAHTLTLKTTQPIPDSPVKEQRPRRRHAPARPVFWKRSRCGRTAEATRPVRGHPDARRHQTPAARALRHVRHEQDVGVSRVESGARRGLDQCQDRPQPGCVSIPRHGLILERR